MAPPERACIMTNVSLVYSTSRCIVSKLHACLIIINMAFCQNYFVDTVEEEAESESNLLQLFACFPKMIFPAQTDFFLAKTEIFDWIGAFLRGERGEYGNLYRCVG